MTPSQFKAWRADLAWTQQQAADALDIRPSTLKLYERGIRYDNDKPVEIPRHIALACAALRAGLSPEGG